MPSANPLQVSQEHHGESPAELQPLTIPDLVRSRAHYLESAPLISYPLTDLTYTDFSASDIHLFTTLVAEYYSSRITPRESSSTPEKVVGLLAPSSLEYLFTLIGLLKLGFCVLFISTRNSDAAIANLLEKTGCRDVIVTERYKAPTERIKKSTHADLQIHSLISKEACKQILESKGTSFIPPCEKGLDSAIEAHKTCWIIHSSGSTGLPKPIFQTHFAALNNMATNFGLRGFITLPLYHGHGVTSVFRSIHAGKQIWVYSADLPLTGKNIVKVLREHDIEIFYGVPYALKLLAETAEGVEALAKCKLVTFGGSSCPDILGDKLVASGVNLVSHYGSTETGQLMTSFRLRDDPYWNYVVESDTLSPYIRWERQGDSQIYELVVLAGLPTKVATNRPDGSYATKDLFTPHPTIPKRWKYYGRLDDTLVLVNGEKAIPLQAEHTIRQNPFVAEAVIFGAGRERLGVIVIPSAENTNITEQELKDSVWKSVETANKDMLQHAKISKEMVSILEPGREYPRTDKGTITRAAFYREFAEEIERVYASLSMKAINGGLELKGDDLKDFLRKKVKEVLNIPSEDTETLTDSTDFFLAGMDSLGALQVQTQIVQNLNIDRNAVGQNVVFENPSVNILAAHLERLKSGEIDSEGNAKTAEAMEMMVKKYSTFPASSSATTAKKEKEGEYVLITGATGSLGAHVVSELVKQPNVVRVYCLVRAKSHTNAQSRVLASLETRKLDHSLSLDNIYKIRSFAADLGKEKIGLEQDIYRELANNVTAVIHSAWSVNFNLNVTSFEAQHIRGVHNLLSLLCDTPYSTPPTFNFISSVSCVAATPGIHIPEAIPLHFDYALAMGYARSKLVAEHIISHFSHQTKFPARILRVGQVVGDTEHGIWNPTEAISLMVQGSTTIGAIPALDENVYWLPVDTVAKVVSELSFLGTDRAPLSCVFHVVNPRPIHWTKDFLPALKAAGLTFEELTVKEWLTKLEESTTDAEKNPTRKLLEFWKVKYGGKNETKVGDNVYRTEVSRYFSKFLRESAVVGKDDVKRFVAFWKTAWQN